MLIDPSGVQRKRRWGMAASFVAHVVLLALITYRPEPIYIAPNFVKLGDGTIATHVVYYAPESFSDPDPVTDNKLAFKSAAAKHHKRNTVAPKDRPTDYQEGDVASRNQKVGAPFGSLWALMAEGHDVKPAIPIEYPSPLLTDDDLPLGMHGDVIIEVTIDRDGFVVDSKLLQGLIHPVDQKALAAVQRWKFRPAILDGTPIASKHDVHFHFPS